MRILLPALSLLLASCTQEASVAFNTQHSGRPAQARRMAYTFEDFIANPEYRHTRDMWRGGALAQYDPAHSHVEFLLEEQRGRLYINGTIAMDFPICSGRMGGSETPKGRFRVTEKIREHRSNRYGSFMSKDGSKVVKRGVCVDDKVPKGAVFEGADMPYWMRFNGAIGMHVGKVRRDMDSHGCVRVPEEAAAILYEKLTLGSRVIVK